MIRKILTSLIIFSLIFTFSSSISFADCGDSGTVGYCGSTAGCGSGERCDDPWWGPPTCTANNMCVNADSSQKIICGYSNSHNKCGAAGGCIAGYRCNDSWLPGVAGCEPKTDADTDPTCTGITPPAEEVPEEEPPANLVCTDGDPFTSGRCGARGGCPNATDMCMAGNCIPTESCADVENPPEIPATGCGANNTVGRCNEGGQCPQGQRCQVGGETGHECVAATECNPPAETPEDPDDGGGGGGGGGFEGEDEPKVNIFEGPTSENFRQLNPLAQSEHVADLSSPGGIVSRLLLFAFPLAGLILFVMIVWGGFEMLTGATGKGIEAGRQRVTAAIVGFVLLFVAYWVFQIVEVIFGVVIL